MSPAQTPHRHLAAALLAGALCAEVFGQGGARSPFLPAQAATGNAPTQGAPLEFRGYVVTGEGVQYRIYDPARKAGAWVRLNERNADFDVIAKKHDGDHNQLVIEYQGRELKLAERESKIISAGNAVLAAPPAPGPSAVPAPVSNVAPAVTQTVVVNPTPQDEAKRLEAVASEVARRRALREQAAQQPAPSTPGVVVPQLQPPPVNFPGGANQMNTGVPRPMNAPGR